MGYPFSRREPFSNLRVLKPNVFSINIRVLQLHFDVSATYNQSIVYLLPAANKNPHSYSYPLLPKVVVKQLPKYLKCILFKLIW